MFKAKRKAAPKSAAMSLQNKKDCFCEKVIIDVNLRKTFS